MKVIVAGGRNITNSNLVYKAINNSGFDITELVHGCCRGVDTIAKEFAEKNNIPHTKEKFKPDWSKGKLGPLIRNKQMAEYSDALIAVWDGFSSGTANMIANACKRGLKIYIFNI